MALTPGGKIAGSVSGGCVEGAVFEAGVEALNTGRPQLLHFGVADETAWEVGLACGGKIDVFVQPLEPAFLETLRSLLENSRLFAAATILEGPDDLTGRSLLITAAGQKAAAGEPAAGGWKFLDEALNALVEKKARQVLAEGRSQACLVEWEKAALQIFIEVVSPPPTLVIVGGVHIAIALTAIARALGYLTIVIDPRRAFANAGRFPSADRLISAWPQEAFAEVELTASTAVAMLTHDPKIDDPALQVVLNSPAFYIGALGSQATQARRRQRLLGEGLSPEQLDRIHGPIGLPIGAESPEEIALAIMAQIVAARRLHVRPIITSSAQPAAKSAA
jgi:xanthine dehydrogenase accessory factor